MKKCQIFVAMATLAAFPAFAASPAIELDYFPPGQNIPLNSDFPVYFMWQPGDLAVPPTHFKLELYKGGTTPADFIGLIARDIPLGKPGVNQTGGGSPENGGTYVWKAGALLAGQAPAGSGYCVRAVTMDGQITSFCYSFNLVAPVPHGISAHRFMDLILASDPACPMCGFVDIGALLAQLGNPADLHGRLVLLRDGREVAVLGRLQRGGLQRGQRVNVRFAAPEIDLIRRGGQGFAVAIVGDHGRQLFSRPIRLKFNN